MSDLSADSGEDVDRHRRERLLRELRGLRAQITRTNRPICFAHVRDEMPEIAGILFAGRGLTNVDLRGADLRDIDFRGSDLSGSNFAGARISGARFEMSKLSRDALRAAADWEIYRDGWSAAVGEKAQNRPQKVHFRRRPGERFSLSPVLPELVIVARKHVGARSSLTPEELEHLDGDRLAVSVNCLTSWEMVRVLKPERLDDTDQGVTSWPVYSAQTYCRLVTDQPDFFGLPRGTTVVLPSDGLHRALASWQPAPGEISPRGLADLVPSDLQLGRRGREFVVRPDENGGVRAVESEGAGRPGLAKEAQRARIRPQFLLGET